MSFGFSISDVFELTRLVHRTYSGWRDACGKYASFTNDLESLDGILSRVEDEARATNSIFKHDPEGLRGWKKVSKGCITVISDLERILQRYDSLSKARGKNNQRRNWDSIQRNWDRLCLGTHSFEELSRRLTKTTTALGAYVSVLGITSQSRVENGLLPDIIRKIDELAAQIRNGNPSISSVMTSYPDDDKTVWKEFRRDLINSGFRSSEIHQYSPALKTYLYRLQRDGMLDEGDQGLQLSSVSEEDVPKNLAAERHENLRLKSQRISYAPKDAQSVAAPRVLETRDGSLGEDEDKTGASSGGDSEVGEVHEYVIGSDKTDRSGSDNTTSGAKPRLQSEGRARSSAAIEGSDSNLIGQIWTAETRPGNSLDKGITMEYKGLNDKDQFKTNIDPIKLPPGELDVDMTEDANLGNENQGLDFVVKKASNYRSPTVEDASDQDEDNGNGCSADQQPLLEEILNQESPDSMPLDRNKPRHSSVDEWAGIEGQDDYADFLPASSRRYSYEGSSNDRMQHETRKAAPTSMPASGSSSTPYAAVSPSGSVKSGKHHSSTHPVSQRHTAARQVTPSMKDGRNPPQEEIRVSAEGSLRAKHTYKITDSDEDYSFIEESNYSDSDASLPSQKSSLESTEVLLDEDMWRTPQSAWTGPRIPRPSNNGRRRQIFLGSAPDMSSSVPTSLANSIENLYRRKWERKLTESYAIDGSDSDVDSLIVWTPEVPQMSHEINDASGAGESRPPPCAPPHPPPRPPWPEARQAYSSSGATVGGRPWGDPPPPPVPRSGSRHFEALPRLQLLEWRSPRRTELHPPMDRKPTLPEGWDFRLDSENRVFYVDTYARGNEKRCFWNAPVKAERTYFAKCPKAWQKICNIFGRIYWLHKESGIISYKHPGLVENFWHNPRDQELYIRDKKSNQFKFWRALTKSDYSIDDTDVIPQIHPIVWEYGISDEAAEVRGELWWGNMYVNEMKLRLTPKSSQKYEGEKVIVMNPDNNTATTVRK